MGETSQIIMPPALVTVVIPCYNLGKTVQRAIESVRMQVLNNLELFVVDDGSTDNSKVKILEAFQDDPRCHYIYQKNMGVANARNHGVFSGDAPYVCCLDADDAIAPEFLEVCVEALEKDPSLGVAYTGLWYIKPDGTSGLSPWPDHFNFDNALRGMNQVPTCNVSRREMWDRLGGQRQRYAPHGAGEEDGEMWLRAGAYGFRGNKVTDAGLFHYSWLSGRVSGDKTHQFVDYRAWHPWTQDNQHPFASCATPKIYSHPVRQYDNPSVSVIIPVSEEHISTLVDALDSLEAQTFRRWEAIGVLDMQGDVPKVLKNAYPYVNWISTGEKKGAGYARNLGAKAARSGLLLFLDADDWLDPQALDMMINVYAEERDIIYSDYIGKSYIEKDTARMFGDRLLAYDEKDKHAIIRYNAYDYDCEEAIHQPRPYKNNEPYLWNLISSLVPKEWHEEIGGFDESMPSWEDWDYWIRMAKAGKCFTRIAEPLVIYRFYTGNRRETGLQSIPDLIQYLERKYEGVNIMPCRSCGKKIYQNTGSNPPTMPDNPLLARNTNIRSTNLSDNDFVLCLYDHPSHGPHRVIGTVTKTEYGYRGGGDTFLVHKADIAAQPNLFKPMELTKPVIETNLRPDPIVDPRQPSPQTVVVNPPKPTVPPAPVKSTPLPKEEKKALGIEDVPNITPLMTQELNARGVHTLDDLMKFGGENLMTIKGIGPAKAAAILKYAHDKLHPAH